MIHNKKLNLVDLSGNNKDISNNINGFFNINNRNHYLFPLHPCNNEKNYQKNKTENSINNKEHFIFNMKLDTVLNKIRNNRNSNYNNSYLNITKKLDMPLLLKNNSDNEKNNEKDSLDTFIQNINAKYNNIHLGKPVNYSRTSRIYKRRQSIFIPNRPLPITNIAPPPPLPPPIEHITIDVEVKTLIDLLELCEKYPLKKNVCYNINMKAIHNIKDPLSELNEMIGMENLKLSIMDQILYFIQDLHHSKEKKNRDFMHTVIYGPPGTGKTEVAKIMGKIFSKMGILTRNIFRKVTRADLIAGYLGQTALKTKDLVQECLGGVIFIDEAYALGNPEKRDSFAKECIDTLCEALSDHKDNLMVIIAGYEEELKNCFFDYNQGLDSRFTWRFKTIDYTPQQLKLIFEKKVKDAEWNIKKELPLTWFEQNKDHFKFFGRDMQTLFSKTKIAHSRRVFCKNKNEKKKITLNDLEKGFLMYCENSQETKDDKKNYAHLYL